MRIRTIKPEFYTHEKLFESEKESKLPLRLAFTGLWCAADREGRFKWEPRRLGVSILPYDQIDFSRVLDALTTRGFIRRYRVNGAEYGVIESFPRHQVINNRESPSVIPAPVDNEEDMTRAPRVDDACPTPLSLAQAEGKGREGEGMDLAPPAVPEVAVKVRPRNVLLDAIASIGGRDPTQTPASSWSNLSKILSELKTVCPNITPEEIKRREENYKLHFQSASLTPNALHKHWPICDTAPTPKPNAFNNRPNSRSYAQTDDYSGITNK